MTKLVIGHTIYCIFNPSSERSELNEQITTCANLSTVAVLPPQVARK